MTKTIQAITVSYTDGSAESFSPQTLQQLSSMMEPYSSLEALILSLITILDKDTAIQEVADALNDEFDEKTTLINKKNEVHLEQSLSTQRGILNGRTIQNVFPLWQCNYDAGDIIAVYDSFDFLTLVGRNANHIERLVFQEVKVGEYVRLNDRQKQLRGLIESINNPKIQFEYWVSRAVGQPFHIVKRMMQ